MTCFPLICVYLLFVRNNSLPPALLFKGIMLMASRNLSVETTFALLGFTDFPELQIPLFLVFLIMYIITLVGNLGMIVIIKINPKFQTPCTLSLVTFLLLIFVTLSLSLPSS